MRHWQTLITTRVANEILIDDLTEAMNQPVNEILTDTHNEILIQLEPRTESENTLTETDILTEAETLQ